MHGGLAGALLASHLVVGTPMASSPSEACLRAAAAAEQRWALPPNLLLAIGRVESGLRDPATGQVQPWPWSANVAGQDYVFNSAAEVGAVVGFLRARGIASIDVGCFQVNLHYHPAAFASVAAGFDPAANADYAARFLRSLFERSGSWETAIADYHSADPVLGADYRAKVLRAWHGLGELAEPSLRVQADCRCPSSRAALWRRDPHVILASAEAAAIPVYTARTLPAPLRTALGLAPVGGHR